MAEIPLRVIGWFYDEAEGVIIVQFEDAAPSTDHDPVNYQPKSTFKVSVSPKSFNKKPKPPRASAPPVMPSTPPQSDQ